MGAVPFQEAKWARLGKRVMSPTSTSSRAPGGAGRSAAVQVHQRGAGGSDQILQFLVGFLGASVDPFEVTDQLRGRPASGLADRVTRPDRGQQGFGLGGGQALLRPTGIRSSSS